MWISRAEYDVLMQRALGAQGERDAMQRQVDSQKTNQEWMVLRLTQLEHERAQLIYRYMDIKITVPTIELDVPVTPESSTIGNDLPSFEDVGDDEAKRQGLDWDANGRVTQHGKVIS
jgi:hypothetical protein